MPNPVRMLSKVNGGFPFFRSNIRAPLMMILHSHSISTGDKVQRDPFLLPELGMS
jgi:hypothetical protein